MDRSRPSLSFFSASLEKKRWRYQDIKKATEKNARLKEAHVLQFNGIRVHFEKSLPGKASVVYLYLICA
jgi:hypothetical protein